MTDYYEEFCMPRTPLGGRVVNSLVRGGYRTRREVFEASDDELLDLRNIGEAAMTLIRSRIGPFRRPVAVTVRTANRRAVMK